MSCQGALLALVHRLEVSGHEGRVAVPSVDLRVTFVSEEERIAVVRAKDDEPFRFRPDIVYPAMGGTSSEMVCADGEHSAAAQVREDQTCTTVLATHQREIKHISAIAIHEHSLRKNDAVSSTRSHVVYQNCSGRCVGHVDEDATVRTVICYDVLQSGCGTRQTGQIDSFHHLEKMHSLHYYILFERQPSEYICVRIAQENLRRLCPTPIEYPVDLNKDPRRFATRNKFPLLAATSKDRRKDYVFHTEVKQG